MEPTCARCGSACELVSPEADPARWECLECWAYVLIPKTWPCLPRSLGVRVAFEGRVIVLSVPCAPLD